MTAEARNGWKRALLIAILVVITAMESLSLTCCTLDTNIESLTDELRTCQSPARKVWIIQTLGAINAASSTGAIRECLDDPDPAVRLASVSSLAKMRGRQAMEALASADQHPDPKIREAAKRARLNRANELSSEEIIQLWQGS